ncbi:YbjN domain-containing protein [Sphaerospermopsis sp. FACHB-1094]|uniref:YbjN domain-containing protein n=1 Tax=Sphaerospermopsis sp. FACHB-1094 TaxID=2692861 RepID=UPI001686F591|nr:YbjN domain-containing protein [Sphaerospermopsis sp. FACHB-1094]MBD2135292.1 YbjN domain-containing protein [Sphaerospermopsis sp. FACHB-1094]
MVGTTEPYQINSELILHNPSQTPLILHAIALSLTTQNNNLIECRLTFQLTPQLYQSIEKEALFNLKPEVRNSDSIKFLPEPNITIETILKPDLLPLLTENSKNIEEAANYILKLNQEQPQHILLSTESWLVLSVKQQQESGEIGYQTLWAYISPENLIQTANSSEKITEGIIKFFQDWTAANLSSLSTKTQASVNKMIEEFNTFLTELDNINPEEITTSSTNSNIFEEIINFFKNDDWPFVQLSEQTALQISFQGKNGKWNCYARAREEQQQFVFYSICPVNAPEEKRLAVAEFITRANSGMMIGNFELDFNDGEISYKTSIDVEGDRISSAFIKRLVYANVMMMDEYLPGILSVIYGNVSPVDAITQIEA